MLYNEIIMSIAIIKLHKFVYIIGFLVPENFVAAPSSILMSILYVIFQTWLSDTGAKKETEKCCILGSWEMEHIILYILLYS
jgi:hypothetical protein